MGHENRTGTTRQAETAFHCHADLGYPLARKFSEVDTMTRFYQPDLTANVDSPFVRGADNKLIRRSYWLDMYDNTLVMVMTRGIGAKPDQR
jgi:hypothetical protein